MGTLHISTSADYEMYRKNGDYINIWICKHLELNRRILHIT